MSVLELNHTLCYHPAQTRQLFELLNRLGRVNRSLAPLVNRPFV